MGRCFRQLRYVVARRGDPLLQRGVAMLAEWPVFWASFVLASVVTAPRAYMRANH